MTDTKPLQGTPLPKSAQKTPSKSSQSAQLPSSLLNLAQLLHPKKLPSQPTRKVRLLSREFSCSRVMLVGVTGANLNISCI